MQIVLTANLSSLVYTRNINNYFFANHFYFGIFSKKDNIFGFIKPVRMSLDKSQPIGIFDSGVGGLTVANAIKNILPSETLIYFGDTAHLPYGDKSKETIINYSSRISEFLLEQQCKIIVIACNSASSNDYNEIAKKVGNKVSVINVIDPVIDYINSLQNQIKLGVIGTKSTIDSKTYPKKIHAKNPYIPVASLATPLLAPMIEEGFIFDDISNAIIRKYLSDKKLKDINALILGCTHYPIIKNQINKYYDFNVNIIDSSKIVAEHVRNVLREKNLLNTGKTKENKFYVSDYTSYFKKLSTMFFEEEIEMEKIWFWN
jgi:glutamate racemase